MIARSGKASIIREAFPTLQYAAVGLRRGFQGQIKILSISPNKLSALLNPEVYVICGDGSFDLREAIWYCAKSANHF